MQKGLMPLKYAARKYKLPPDWTGKRDKGTLPCLIAGSQILFNEEILVKELLLKAKREEDAKMKIKYIEPERQRQLKKLSEGLSPTQRHSFERASHEGKKLRAELLITELRYRFRIAQGANK